MKELILDNNKKYLLESIGSDVDISADIMIDYKMIGSEQSMYDPKNKDKIIIYSFPSILGYGVIFKDKICCKGVIIDDLNDHPNNFMMLKNLRDKLIEDKVVCLINADTRSICREIKLNNVKKATIKESANA